MVAGGGEEEAGKEAVKEYQVDEAGGLGSKMKYLDEMVKILREHYQLKVAVYSATSIAHLFVSGGKADTFAAYAETLGLIAIDMVGDQYWRPYNEVPTARFTTEISSPKKDYPAVLADKVANFHAINVKQKRDAIKYRVTEDIPTADRVLKAQELTAQAEGFACVDDTLYRGGDNPISAHVRRDGRVVVYITCDQEEFIRLFGKEN